MCEIAPKRLRLIRTGCAFLGALATFCFVTPAAADEPVKATEPRVLSEPGEITSVVDAFDEGDPFDLHITLGYQHTWKNATIRRETALGYPTQPTLSSGGYTSDSMNVASYKESTSRLTTRIDAGLYRDIALYLRMPIILSNSRQLDGLDGSDRAQGVVLQGVPGEQLFSLPFKSPNRSGIEYLALGIDANIFNQGRDHTKPTWLVGLEGRFNISEPMRACNANPVPGKVGCADPSDVNRDGISQGGAAPNYEGSFSGQRKAGVSRGTTALELHTYISRRVKYVEPYGGFRALFEFPNAKSDYGLTDLKGSVVNHPPLEGTVIMGMMVIPWENREQFQRLTVDGRLQGTYRSEGRDYSELFDALGSSQAMSLRRPNYAEYMAGGGTSSVVNPNSQRVYFTGITDVQAHGALSASGSVTWQAGEYVKFQFGMGYTYVQSHFITMEQPCNPDFAKDSSKAGPCHTSSKSTNGTESTTTTGIPNPNFRAAINQVGTRFKVDDVSLVDLWFNGVVMF